MSVDLAKKTHSAFFCKAKFKIILYNMLPPPPAYARTTERKVCIFQASCQTHPATASAFTLIELSIVIVIIGLVVGVVLAGRSMVRASEVRATLTQIEKFNAATNTFRGKYEGLPGDLIGTQASRFGFIARGPYAGQGDGNGIIEGLYTNGANQNNGTIISTGETAAFWVDLSAAKLIEGSFTTASEMTLPAGIILPTTIPNINAYIPEAKLAHNNSIFVYSYQGINYFALQGVTYIGGDSDGFPRLPSGAFGTLTPREAQAIDAKTDDGMPLTGRTLAQFVHCCGAANLPGSTTVTYAGFVSGPASTQNWPHEWTCYDNNGVAGVQPTYTFTPGNGDGLNCALSFKFQ